MRFLRICGWSLLGLVGLLMLCVGAIWLGGAPAVRWLAEHPLSTAMGR